MNAIQKNTEKYESEQVTKTSNKNNTNMQME